MKINAIPGGPGSAADFAGARPPEATTAITSGPADHAWFSPRLGWYGVCIVSLVTMFGQLDRGIMALLVVSIKRDTGMSDTQISLLMGLAYSMVYMCVGLPMARVSDRARRTFILPGALAVWSLGTALCGLAQSFAAFFVFRGIVGAGEAVKGPTSTSLIADLVPPHRMARAFGIYNIAITVGEAGALILGGLLLGYVATLAPIHVPFIGDLHGWRLVYLIFGLPGIVLALIFVLTLPEPARHGRLRADERSVPIKDVLLFLVRGPSARMFVPLFIAATMSSLYLMGNVAWKPAFYQRTFGLTPAQFGPIAGSINLIMAPVGVVIGSFVVERMGRRWDDAYMRLVLISDLIMIPIAIAIPLMPTFGGAVTCQAALSLMLMVSIPARTAATQLITPNEMRAQINAVFMFTIGVIGTGLGPYLLAAITDYAFQDETQLRYAMMSVAAVATPVCAICAAFALRAYRAMLRDGRIKSV
jgi:MFS family permease